jgi:hypothetical protein
MDKYDSMSRTFAKKDIKHDYFKTWSDSMAYILGFIYADGCLYRNTYGSYQLNFCLKRDDEYMLNFIKSELSAENNIEYYTCDTNFKNGYTSARLRICNRTIGHDLVSLGLTQRKSLTSIFPNIPDGYINHFIRGYFDGDGTFTIARQQRGKYNYLRAQIVSGSYEFIYGLRDRISNKVFSGLLPAISKTSCFQIAYGGSHAVELGNWLYDTGGFFMGRKKDVWSKFK